MPALYEVQSLEAIEFGRASRSEKLFGLLRGQLSARSTKRESHVVTMLMENVLTADSFYDRRFQDVKLL